MRELHRAGHKRFRVAGATWKASRVQIAYAQLTFGFHMANMPLGLGRHAQMCRAQTWSGRFCIIGTPRIDGGVADAGTSLNGMM